jgi:hypothetical protein
VRWDCDWPGCSEHVRFWAPLGDPEREGWAMHVAVTPERHEAELDRRHYYPAHAKGGSGLLTHTSHSSRPPRRSTPESLDDAPRTLSSLAKKHDPRVDRLRGGGTAGC